MNRRVAVRAIIINDGKLLCVRQKHYKGSIVLKTDFWCTPGGGLDEGESMQNGLKREVMEELGIVPIIGDLLYIQQFMHDDKEHMEFFFHVTNSADFLDIDLSKTSHGVEEIAEVDFVDPATKNVLPKFLVSEPLGEIKPSGNVTKVISYLN